MMTSQSRSGYAAAAMRTEDAEPGRRGRTCSVRVPFSSCTRVEGAQATAAYLAGSITFLMPPRLLVVVSGFPTSFPTVQTLALIRWRPQLQTDDRCQWLITTGEDHVAGPHALGGSVQFGEGPWRFPPACEVGDPPGPGANRRKDPNRPPQLLPRISPANQARQCSEQTKHATWSPCLNSAGLEFTSCNRRTASSGRPVRNSARLHPGAGHADRLWDRRVGGGRAGHPCGCEFISSRQRDLMLI